MTRVVVEACVDSLAGALAAEEGGADRVELCVSLEVGGLTPPDRLIAECLSALTIPVHVLVRPSAESFVVADPDAAPLTDEVRRIVALGVGGIVAGALTREGKVSRRPTALVVAAAAPLPVTFHRAFDAIHDQAAALEVLVELGVARVLTSGAAPTALEGAARLRDLVDQADGRIGILAAGTVRAHNAQALVRATGVTEIHGRTSSNPEEVRALVRAANAG